MAEECKCCENCTCKGTITIKPFACENNYEYQIIDENGDVFLQGDGFETYEEARQWLVDLANNINGAIDKLPDHKE